MSVLRIIWYFIEFLVAIYLAAFTKNNSSLGILFLALSKIVLKQKTFHFLFLLCLNISIAYFQKRRKNDSKSMFGEISKTLPTCYPKETFSYFRRYTDNVVYFFTRASGRGDEESSDDDSSRKEESSQQSGERKEVASDTGNEKQDADAETKQTTSQSFLFKPIRKRKGDAEEIGMKRSKFEGRSVETGMDCAEAIENPPPGRRSSANSDDRPQALFSDRFNQDSDAASSTGAGAPGIEQVVAKPDPDESASNESMLLSPPAEKTPPSVKNSNSEESSPEEPMNVDTAAKAVESMKLSPKKKDRDSRKESCSCKSSFQGDNWQRAEEVPPVEFRDSVASRDSKDDNMRQTIQRSIIPIESRHVPVGDKSTNRDVPDVVTSSTESRISQEIAQATKEFFKTCFERSKPKDPRMSGRKITGGNPGQSEGGSIRIQYKDITAHPLFRSWPRVDRPGPSSDLGCITIFYHKDSRGKTQYYREYPGLSLQPLSVKKDATYQKRFYKHQRSMIMPIKMGEMIQCGIDLSQNLIGDIPRYPTSDEDKLSLEEYHELSQQLLQGLVRAYKTVQEGEWKNRRAKKRSAERRKTGYAKSSFQEESPSDSSGDETIYMHSLHMTPSKDLSKRCTVPISPSESARQPMNLQLPDFSFDCNVPRVSPQSEFFQAIAPKIARLPMSHHQYSRRKPEHRVHRYGSHSNPHAYLQPVEIKFVPESSRNSTRFIYCRDNMSFDSGENSRIRLKPFFEVQKVLRLEGRWPSVSVEEFLQALLTFQELYYQMLYDESERFYTFREDIYRCIIPMRSIESNEDELDEDNPNPRLGHSSNSVVSYGEVSSSTSETNVPGGSTSKNVEGKEFAIGSAVDTFVDNKRKHEVWYPPVAKEAGEDTGLDRPPDNSETESASE